MNHIVRSRALRTLLLVIVASTLLGGTALAATTVPTSLPDAVRAQHLPVEDHCDRGEFCTWDRTDYRGEIYRLDLRTANPDECIPLPDGVDGRSFTNRTDQLVTVYQGRDCSTEGDFTTYPGGGAYVPQAPFVVRGVQVWD